jgi:hypothetical protein
MRGTPLVQANHYVTPRFAKNNADILEGEGDEDVFSLAGSTIRAETLKTTLAEMPDLSTLERSTDSLNCATVLNPDTCQQMAFCPARSELKVRRRRDQ